ncbi:MAG: nuclear transport factor 2 family protein, partial [Nevskia sp.]|nr:nuclear transport factor 2 family protein [Nevskia sp.]
MSKPSMEKQLQELLDKQALYELICAYCNAADRHDHDKMRALYHEDAIDDHGHYSKGPAKENRRVELKVTDSNGGVTSESATPASTEAAPAAPT